MGPLQEDDSLPVPVLTDDELHSTQLGIVYKYTEAKFYELQGMMQVSDQNPEAAGVVGNCCGRYCCRLRVTGKQTAFGENMADRMENQTSSTKTAVLSCNWMIPHPLGLASG